MIIDCDLEFETIKEEVLNENYASSFDNMSTSMKSLDMPMNESNAPTYVNEDEDIDLSGLSIKLSLNENIQAK